MARRLIIHPQAEIDVVDAVSWYEDHSAGLGDQLLSELDSVIQRVLRNPLHFPRVRQDVRRALLHRFPYSIYFQASDETIELIAVLHQHRDPRVLEKRIVSR